MLSVCPEGKEPDYFNKRRIGGVGGGQEWFKGGGGVHKWEEASSSSRGGRGSRRVRSVSRSAFKEGI